MAKQFKVSADLNKRIETLASDLRDAAEEFRNLYDERSERWQEGDAAMAADTWIESIENLADELENMPERPE